MGVMREPRYTSGRFSAHDAGEPEDGFMVVRRVDVGGDLWVDPGDEKEIEELVELLQKMGRAARKKENER